MILDATAIENIILNNPNSALISKLRTQHSLLKLHFYGGNAELKQHLKTVDGFEKPTLTDLRAKYSKSNKDLMSRIARPIDKIFSARGGSLYYNLPDSVDKKARQLASNVRDGYSVKNWVKDFWATHYKDDPGGVIFMEIANAKDAAKLKSEGRSFVYPTYKSISTIYDYQPSGSSLEYIVFELSKDEIIKEGLNPDDLIYRVVDDAFDYLVKKGDKQIYIYDKFTLPNFFMQVPAILNSDIINPNNDSARLSVFDDVIELAEEFLLKGSIKITHDFLHAFPKYWQYANECKPCSGSGMYEGKKCETCGGLGIRSNLRVDEAIQLGIPDKENPRIDPPGGYISPDKNYYDIVTTELQALEDLMIYTIWGAAPQTKTQGLNATQQGDVKTATEIVSEVKPQADRLTFISETAEKRHKFILDSIIKIQISQSYQGAAVSYGKRYMIESPDEIWNKYIDAKTKGAATSVLNDMLSEYYEARYNSDPIRLAIQQKLSKVEPFVHYTVTQVQAFMTSEEDYKAKLYFSEWLATVSDAMILSMTEQDLRNNLYQVTGLKTLPQPEPKKIAA